MPIFQYEAQTHNGRSMKGSLEAGSLEEVHAALGAMALKVQSVEKAPAASMPRLGVSRTEFMLFNEQLASITKAGLPLERGLRELSAEVDSKPMRGLVTRVADELEAGQSLDAIFEKHKHQVPPLYSHILKAGLQSGRLSEMLVSLNRHMEMASLTRRLLLEALTYPIVVLLLAGGVVTFFFRVLVPQFDMIFEEFGARVPDTTRVLLAIARNAEYFWMALAIVIVGSAVASLLLGRSATGRRIRERTVLRIPILGRIFCLGTLSRLADAMSTLVAAGCDMPSCFRLGGRASGSELMSDSADRLAQHIEAGTPLAETASEAGQIPQLFLYAMVVGSQRNQLQDSLRELSEMYRRQVSLTQSRLQALLLPMLLVILGFVIGAMLVTLLLPMVSMLNSVQSF